ncbi:MAG: hypothetical protein GF308_13045 [Candidatus Heimdallarchaeota archaeon]|nr:hypothetical protein [Candidatus Heimdallarchaeota archaeon]
MSEDELEFGEEESKFRDSYAFSDYKYGQKTIKRSWVLISLTGVLGALFSFTIGILASLFSSSQWWINLLLSLIGLPLGFLISCKNSYDTLLKDISDAVMTAFIYALTYFVIGLIIALFFSATSVFSMIFGIFSFWAVALIIGIYSICIFVLGALVGNIYQGLSAASN